MFDPAILEITDEDMLAAAASAIANIASISLAVDYPTLAAVPHIVINGYKNLLAIAVETEYSFPLADKVRAALPLLLAGCCGCCCSGPAAGLLGGQGAVQCGAVGEPMRSAGALARRAPPTRAARPRRRLQVKAYLADPSAFAVAAAPATGGAPAAAAAAPEPEESEEEDMGFSLFD
jgi:hypothetical protein